MLLTKLRQRLEEPLRDLSVSRTSFAWGIPVPTADPAVGDTPDAPGQTGNSYMSCTCGSRRLRITCLAVGDTPDAPAGQQHVMYVWFDALTNYLSGSSNAFAAAAARAGAGCAADSSGRRRRPLLAG